MKKRTYLSLAFSFFFFVAYNQNHYADCQDAMTICSKGTYWLESLPDGGRQLDEVKDLTNCMSGLTESHSAWIKWEVGKDGNLIFDLTPDDLNDDIDFVLFRLDAGLDNCDVRHPIRCMASGKNLGDLEENYLACMGPTGLAYGNNSVQETKGCMTENNNFLAPVHVKEGEAFALFIHNYSSSGGLLFQIEGTAELQVESPVKILMEHQQEKKEYQFFTTISDTNISGKQYWNFGDAAFPTTAVGPGPHRVVYTNSGVKIVQTTIETINGCVLGAIYSLNAESTTIPIEPTSDDLNVFPNPTNNTCQLQLNWNSNPAWSRIYLIDVLGNVLFTRSYFLTEKTEPLTLNLEKFPSGTYFIELKTAEKNYQKKLVKL